MDQSMYIVLCSSTVNPCSSCLMLTKSPCTSFVTYSNRCTPSTCWRGCTAWPCPTARLWGGWPQPQRTSCWSGLASTWLGLTMICMSLGSMGRPSGMTKQGMSISYSMAWSFKSYCSFCQVIRLPRAVRFFLSPGMVSCLSVMKVARIVSSSTSCRDGKGGGGGGGGGGEGCC